MPEDFEDDCYLCGAPLDDSNDSGRCDACLEEQEQQDDGWDN